MNNDAFTPNNDNDAKLYKDILVLSVLSLLFTLLSIATFVGMIFGTGISFDRIFAGGENNIFSMLVNNSSLFFEDQKNLIFLILFVVSLLFFFVGFLFIPVANISKARLLDDKKIFRYVSFTSPLSIVFLIGFPIMWLFSHFFVIIKCSKNYKNEKMESEDITNTFFDPLDSLNNNPMNMPPHMMKNMNNPHMNNNYQSVVPVRINGHRPMPPGNGMPMYPNPNMRPMNGPQHMPMNPNMHPMNGPQPMPMNPNMRGYNPQGPMPMNRNGKPVPPMPQNFNQPRK